VSAGPPVNDGSASAGLPRGATGAARLVSRVLLWGGATSVALMVIGLALFVAHGGFHAGTADFQRIVRRRAEGQPPVVFVSVREVVRGALHRPPEPLALIALGILMLVVTPVVGVATAIPAFARAGDRDYAIIATIVLAVLVVSFLLAGGAG
jgi:uncharacterized membrane protein